MPNLNPKRAPIDPALRIEIARSLQRLIDAAQDVVIAAWVARPADGSRAKADWDSPHVTRRFARGAHESVFYGLLSGLDHARAATDTLASGRSNFAIATLIRGALESYARAWWILSAEDARELVSRWLACHSKELRDSLQRNPNGKLVDLDGKIRSTQEVLEEYESDLVALWGSVLQRPKYTAMAATLAEVHAKDLGRERYSFLSAIAHGESLGLHALLYETPGRAGVMLPIDFVYERAFDIYALVATTTLTFYETWGFSPGPEWALSLLDAGEVQRRLI